MKRISQLLIGLLFHLPISAQVISQYIETSSGTTPKGIEIWNNTPTELSFATHSLVIEKGTNGAVPSADFTLSTGTLASGKVMVIGSSDMQVTTETNGSAFYLKAFTFNGDDALVVKYGGVITDVFGLPGTDPGVEWSGNGVSTANQNIALKEGITTGDTDGWSDPSGRFTTISTDNTLTGFGIAPIWPTGSLAADPDSLNNFFYTFQHGPSGSQSFSLSGNSLSGNIILTPPAHFEVSTDNSTFVNGPVTLTPVANSLAATPVYVRLIAGLAVGGYGNEPILISSVGAANLSVICSGSVQSSGDMGHPISAPIGPAVSIIVFLLMVVTVIIKFRE